MKLLKLAVSALAVAAIAAASSAQAYTTVYVAGSTAFRAAACAAIVDYLHSNNPSATIYDAYYYINNPTIYLGGSQPSNCLGADAALIGDGTIGGSATANIVVSCYWTGSLAGLVDLVVGSSPSSAYIDPTSATTISTFNGNPISTSNYADFSSTGGVNNAGTGYLGYTTGSSASSVATVAESPNFIFSDSYNATIAAELSTANDYYPTVLGSGAYPHLSNLVTAVKTTTGTNGVKDSVTATGNGSYGPSGPVGIVPFEWAIGACGSTNLSNITNITMSAANTLLGAGYIPQAALTGGTTNADTTNFFYLVGRNEDSGTRIDSFCEARFLTWTTTPYQYQVGGYAGNSSSSALGAANTGQFPPTALNTEPAITWNADGHSGYATGSDVRTALGQAETLTDGPVNMGENSQGVNTAPAENTGNVYFMGYLGVTDASKLTVASGTGKPLSYNGVSYSVANVQSGAYTLWGYEHVYHLANLSGTALAVCTGVANNIFNTDADVTSSGVHAQTSGGTAAGILLNSSMKVKRTLGEGGGVSPNY